MIEEKSPFEIEPAFNYASPIKRTVAGVLDGIFVLVASFLISGIITYLIFGMPDYPTNRESQIIAFRFTIIFIFFRWLYLATLESSPKQATFGKMLFGLKVVDEAGERLTFMRATGRCFAKYLSSLMLLVGFLMMFWDKKRQGLHDKLAHTYVVTSDK